MGKLKKIGIAIGSLVAAFFVLGIITIAINYDGFSSGVEQKLADEPIIVTKNAEDLLPTRDDVGTIWKFSNTGLRFSEYSEWEGLVEIIGKKYDAGGGLFDVQNVVVNIFKFDTPENSKQRLDQKIIQLREKGGYEEVNVNAYDANCYGLEKEWGAYGLEENIQYRCVKGNIYVFVSAITDDFDGKRQAGDFMRIILDKIN